MKIYMIIVPNENWHVEYWYARTQGGNWWATKIDNDGCQIDEALTAYHKEELKYLIESTWIHPEKVSKNA